MKPFVLRMLLMALTIPAFSAAQQTCKDENLRDPFFSCGTPFNPVCACDGETYYNECAARYHGGILSNQWSDGPCTPFYFKILPNLSIDNAIHLDLQFRQAGSAILYIFDSMGNLKFRQNIQVSNSFPYQRDLDVTVYQAGLYYLVISGQDHQQIERFVVLHQ